MNAPSKRIKLYFIPAKTSMYLEWSVPTRLLQLQNNELRHLWQEGIESGSGQYSDIEAIKQEARRRLGLVSNQEV